MMLLFGELNGESISVFCAQRLNNSVNCTAVLILRSLDIHIFEGLRHFDGSLLDIRSFEGIPMRFYGLID